VTPSPPTTPWADRAARLYDERYARRYRECDDGLVDVGATRALADWLHDVSSRFGRPIDVLDLGCGTGRYFFALDNVRRLVGLDASDAMLAEARRPPHEDLVRAESVTLVQGDLLTHPFADGEFDLVYSVGVLAEHTPLTRALVDRVRTWLRPGGRFAFTTVHPESPSVSRGTARRLAQSILPFTPGPLGHLLHARLMAGGMYADEAWVAAQLAPGLLIETMERFTSEVHLHVRVVAFKEGG
jgi:SAM-dependent methyltransferase